MAQNERIVMREVPAGGHKRTDYIVEYMDGEGKWVEAVGTWGWGTSCRSSYPTEDAAGMVATEIAQQADHRTRVIKVVSRGN